MRFSVKKTALQRSGRQPTCIGTSGFARDDKVKGLLPSMQWWSRDGQLEPGPHTYKANLDKY